jgi:hypothetical protein
MGPRSLRFTNGCDGLYGTAAHLALTANAPQGVIATIDGPT